MSFARQKESVILEQLNDLISRDLLVVQEGPQSLVRDLESDKITIQQSIRLVLKDKEYIEKLEIENRALKESIQAIREAVRTQVSAE